MNWPATLALIALSSGYVVLIVRIVFSGTRTPRCGKGKAMDSVIVPSGKYWLGDPCYAVPRPRWGSVCDSIFEGKNEPIKIRGGIVVAFGTMHGDGEYFGNDGNSYAVDAGLIGLTSVGAAIKNPSGVQLVEFSEPTLCERRGGVLAFGSIEIDTDPRGEEEDEECNCRW